MCRASIGLWFGVVAVAPSLAAFGAPQGQPGSGESKPATFAVAPDGEPGEDGGAETSATPAQQYQAILQEYNRAQQEFFNAYQAAKTAEERGEAAKLRPRPEAYAGRLLQLAQASPDDPAAFDALVWIVQNVSRGSELDDAVAMLIEKHATSPGIAQVCQRLMRSRSPAAEKLLRAVLADNPHREIKQTACTSLAQFLKNQSSMALAIKNAQGPIADQIQAMYGADEVARLKQLDTDALNQEAEKLFLRAVEEFGDFDSLIAVIQNSAAGASGLRAAEILIEDHIANARLQPLLAQLGRSQRPSAAAEKLLRGAMEKSSDRSVKGKACFYLAQYLKNQSDLVRQMKLADENMLQQYRGFLGDDIVAKLRGTDTETLRDEAESLLARVVKEFSDVSSSRGGTLGDVAEPELFELRHLSIGKVAPDIEAEDIDGEQFKLSDYRGKVVMLDFWGHW